MAQNDDAYNSNRRRNTIAGGHRLSFWQKDEKSHKLYLKGGERKYSSLSSKADYGPDNFSYDNAHLVQWLMPDDILLLIPKLIPADLGEKVKDWSKAGAALCTALDRIDVTYKQAMFYAYPNPARKSIVRRISGPSAVVSAETPPISGFATPADVHSDGPYGRSLLIQTFPQALLNKPEIGMESPPPSVLDSGVASPMTLPEDYKGVLPDLAKINREFVGLPSPETLTPVTGAGYDQNSWETFNGAYDKLLKDCQESFKRFDGYAKVVEVQCKELHICGGPFTKEAIAIFAQWWDGMKHEVSKYEKRVLSLTMPNLEHVTFEYEIFRSKSNGRAPNVILDSA